ncbi:hypothetical protein [Bartonella massiliensis]|uniref:hypothetical protein n=1 Tax=Bartonella massiliensis TaxID=929795 RepID=UPI00163CF371|nr:hypothetical protein [Bartonella massiliensis]
MHVFVKTIAAAGGVILASLIHGVWKNALDNLDDDVFGVKLLILFLMAIDPKIRTTT